MRDVAKWGLLPTGQLGLLLNADEVREIIIGHSILQQLLLVSFTERGEDSVRIINARKATK